MARKKSTKQTASDGKPVVRDATFVRLYADDVVVVNLGRDFELVFIAVGNPITRMTRLGGEDEDTVSQSIESRSELTETGRARISPFAALNVAMNTLGRLIDSNQVDTDMLRKAVEQMIDEAGQKPGPGESE